MLYGAYMHCAQKWLDAKSAKGLFGAVHGRIYLLHIPLVFLLQLIGGKMILDEIYNIVRKPLPKNLKRKKELFTEFRLGRYQGEINSQIFLIKNDDMRDLGIAIKSQIEHRLRYFTIISSIIWFSGFIDLLIRLICIL